MSLGRAALVAAAALAVLPLAGLAQTTVPEEGAELKAARELLVAQGVHQALVLRWKWATLWDYGITELTQKGFVDASDCEQEASRQDRPMQENRGPLYLTNDAGHLEQAPYVFCREATPRDLQELALMSLIHQDCSSGLGLDAPGFSALKETCGDH